MFGIDSSELMLIALVALLVIGPKDLPKAMRWVGQWVGKARAMSRHLRTGFDSMMREAELEEMQKLWAQQNEAIMKATVLPENMLPDLSGPIPAEPVVEPESPPVAAETPPAPPKRPRKPRAKKAATAPEGEQA
ncbi:Sec-independent protein translocase protein TatB [Sandarakinorhabdus sp. AAP62]|uniref:Sec-independent protein translocase protein TatB n=1 Tax=Sandarakinorhabdus sp. AAP62 TaxID=1248916 RepID=UPI0002E3799D|nr:Sec-independent protein translocase protein TatB [Sandarakinorhabdus sp. AAP62]